MVVTFEVPRAPRNGRIERFPTSRTAACRPQRLRPTCCAGRAVECVEIRVDTSQAIGRPGRHSTKTTTFYLLAGLIRSDQRRVILDGKRITYLPLRGNPHLSAARLTLHNPGRNETSNNAQLFELIGVLLLEG